MTRLLEFEAARHQYRLDGVIVPSVTQVLAPYSGLEFADKAALEAGRDRGTRVHEACELHDQGRLDRETLPEDLEPYVEAWDRVQHEGKLVSVATELRVYSEKYRYAGTLDRVMRHPNRGTVVCDIKTGNAIPKTVGWQTVAYQRAYNEMNGGGIRHRACILLRPDGTFRLEWLDDAARDWALFLSCLNLWRAINER